jgi:hypothetical protein
VKDDLQGYSNFRKCIEAEEKLNVALPYVLVIEVKDKNKLHMQNVNAIKIQCNLKRNYTRKSKSYTKLK